MVQRFLQKPPVPPIRAKANRSTLSTAKTPWRKRMTTTPMRKKVAPRRSMANRRKKMRTTWRRSTQRILLENGRATKTSTGLRLSESPRRPVTTWMRRMRMTTRTLRRLRIRWRNDQPRSTYTTKAILRDSEASQTNQVLRPRKPARVINTRLQRLQKGL